MTPIKIGDTTYQLKYTFKNVLKLEGVISTKNVSVLIGSGMMSHGDLLNCLYFGLLAEQPSMNYNKAMNLFERWLESNSILSLYKIIINAMAKDKVVGKADGDYEEEVENATAEEKK